MRRFAITVALCLGVVCMATPARAGEVRPGEALPAVALADWSGHPFDFTRVRGQIVVIDFWASWCATCRSALPALDAIGRRHPELTVVAINIDKHQATAERFLAEHLPQARMLLLRDPEGAALARFGAAGMPALYVVDRDGLVRLVEGGYATERLPSVEATIDNLLHSAVAATIATEGARPE